MLWTTRLDLPFGAEKTTRIMMKFIRRAPLSSMGAPLDICAKTLVRDGSRLWVKY
jgi:hypothetical protein